MNVFDLEQDPNPGEDEDDDRSFRGSVDVSLVTTTSNPRMDRGVGFVSTASP